MAGRSPFPPASLDEALSLARTIWEHNAGHPMRRVTIFHTLERQPESSTSRQLITASAGYGLTEGNYKSDTIKLTDRGRAIAENNTPQDRIEAVLGVHLFRVFFDQYRDKAIPSRAAAVDFLREQGISEDSALACLEIILKNGRQVGLIHEFSGKERITTPDHALEKLGRSAPTETRVFPKTSQDEPELAEQIQTPALPKEDEQSKPRSNGIPTLHIDIQIHIAADAGPDQIDQIFASMAKHLYTRG